MRHLSILLLGALVNSVGSGLTAFGLAIFAYEAYGTASAVALVQLCAFAPIILLAPAAGVLADRFDRRLMMLIGDGGSVVGLALILIALTRPEPRLSHILAGVVISSCLAALTEPALRASVSDLVEPKDHVRSAGLLQAAGSARYLLSPIAAGALLPHVGLPGLLIIDAATCLVTAGCSGAVMRAVGRRAASATGSASIADQLLGGWRAVRGDSAVRALVGLMTVMTLLIGMLQVLLKPIVLPYVDAAAMGRIETLAAAGILVGAAAVAALAKAQPTALLIIGTAATGAAMIGLALRPWPWWVALCGFAVFASLALCQAGADTLVRRAIPQDHQARAWGTISLITQTGYILAYVSAGPLTDGVLSPLLARDGALSSGLAAVIGTGPGRGAAALVALAGVATLALAGAVARRRHDLSAHSQTPSESRRPTSHSPHDAAPGSARMEAWSC